MIKVSKRKKAHHSGPLMQTRPSVKWCCSVAEKTKPWGGAFVWFRVCLCGLFYLLHWRPNPHTWRASSPLPNCPRPLCFPVVSSTAYDSVRVPLSALASVKSPPLSTAALGSCPTPAMHTRRHCSHYQLQLQFLCEDCRLWSLFFRKQKSVLYVFISAMKRNKITF